MIQLSLTVCLALFLLTSCKKTTIERPNFSRASSDDAAGESSPSGDEDEPISDDEDAGSDDEGDSASDEDSGSEDDGGELSGGDIPDTFTIWNGTSSLGKANGDGYTLNKSTKKAEILNKAMFSDRAVKSTQKITEDQISEAMTKLAAYKDVTASGTSACDADGLLKQKHIAIKTGSSEVIVGIGSAKCEAQRYIDLNDFEKFLTWFRETFPNPTGTPGTTTP